MDSLSHWDLAERFSVQEAACLLVGIDPARPGHEWWRAKPATERLSAAYDQALAVVTFEFPCEMIVMLEAMERATDALPSFHLEACIICGDDVMSWHASPKAEFKVQEFERKALHRWIHANGIPTAYPFAPVALQKTQEPTRQQPTAQRGAMWPPHDTKHLSALRLAATRYWTNYDPNDPSTAPTNAVVSHWLQKHQGISATVADVMATILRPDGMKPGPRPSPK